MSKFTTSSLLVIALLLAAVLLAAASSLVSAMSPIDAFEEAKRHHKNIGDRNFEWEEYNVYNDHIRIKPEMRGNWAHPKPPRHSDNKMPHAPGSEIAGPHHN
jgi:hypothetical protein